MKIAIQGHPYRGNEVIKILESLGGINDGLHKGNNPNCYYELHGNIIWCVSTKGINFKYCTLEEFKEEFPFKVGDKVRDCSDNEIGIIFNFIDIDNELMYVVDFEKSGHANMPAEELKPYNEMKEERNITLTFDKAKEWYKKGGELKEIALQAYSEEELTKAELPKSWEEFCEKYSVKKGECVLESEDRISATPWNISIRRLKTWIPSKKSAEAHLALMQLEQLRDCYNNSCNDTNRIAIINNNGNIQLYVDPPFNCFLTFKNHLLAREFFSNFKEIIEIAKELI